MRFSLIPRFHLFELEDQPWLPRPFRIYLTDLMEITSRWFALRTPLLPLLGRLLDHAKADTITDLCSGSSGPLRWFAPRLEEACGRPIRAGRLFWTYAFPVVPVMAFWDGLVSCLRTYSPKELPEMIKDLSPQEYVWETGRIQVHGLPAHVTYLLGYAKVV